MVKKRISGPKNVGSEGRRVGRPNKLEPTPELMRQARALARIFATHDEIAAVFDVASSTWMDFLGRFPVVRDQVDAGRAEAKLSAKRKLIKLADTNAQAAIFLSRQAGFTDRLEISQKSEITIHIDAEDAEV